MVLFDPCGKHLMTQQMGVHMRKSLAALGVGAIATGAVLLPAVPASAAQTEANANKIKTWERIWFRGAGGGSGVNFVQNLAPPVTGELKNG